MDLINFTHPLIRPNKYLIILSRINIYKKIWLVTLVWSIDFLYNKRLIFITESIDLLTSSIKNNFKRTKFDFEWNNFSHTLNIIKLNIWLSISLLHVNRSGDKKILNIDLTCYLLLLITKIKVWFSFIEIDRVHHIQTSIKT